MLRRRKHRFWKYANPQGVTFAVDADQVVCAFIEDVELVFMMSGMPTAASRLTFPDNAGALEALAAFLRFATYS